MPEVWRGVGFQKLFKLRNGNQGAIEMTYIEKFWRDATAADVARVMGGETVEARFTQNNGSTRKGFIAGWKETPAQWMDNHGLFWDRCQVYAPQQWFLDKPDPGEGYRLLGKFPDEALQPGDEVFNLRFDGKWEPSSNVATGYGQNESTWYRRRIEPKPEPKFKVGQRVKIIGPKRSEKVRYNWEQGMDNQVGKTGVVTGSHYGSFGRLYQLSGIVEWNFQEDYLEPVVEPEPKHYVLQVGDSVETPSGHLIKIVDRPTEQMHYTLQVGDTVSTPSGRQAVVTEHGVEVT